ncbi:hypothetical protein SNE40_018271 [Patella caerulea]|uniref:Uncharacterized protein n=1 Tax=Patella caerulea TaxID=87958 RepID=A0AAN8J9B6_PATCE
MVTSLLSCFHGPQVEASFSVMNNVIDSKTCRLNISTYNAIQHENSGLTASGKSAVQFYAKNDFVHDKIDTNLAKNMVAASTTYKREIKKRKEKSEEKKEYLRNKKQSLN